MLSSNTPRCPHCDGVHLGRSQWRSHDEKHRHPGRRPLRCTDCGHRFLAEAAPGGANAGRTALIIGGAVAALAATVGIGVLLSPGGDPEAIEQQPAAVSTSFTPAAMKAAEEGDVEAQFMVGSALLADAETNLAYSTKALGFLQQAAERGHGRAMLRLGVIYKKGIDAPQNYGLAAKWIEKAALLGEPQGMLELGRLYREGIGMPQDMVKAYVWLNRAAAARDQDAPRERGDVARLLTQTELRHAQDATLNTDMPASDIAPPAGLPTGQSGRSR